MRLFSWPQIHEVASHIRLSPGDLRKHPAELVAVWHIRVVTEPLGKARVIEHEHITSPF